MKYHSYDMMLINESFDGSDPDANGLLVYVERLSMDVRRNVFVGLLTQRFPSMDNMAAFLKSVNITINVKDIGSIDRILSRGISEYEFFYSTFRAFNNHDIFLILFVNASVNILYGSGLGQGNGYISYLSLPKDCEQ